MSPFGNSSEILEQWLEQLSLFPPVVAQQKIKNVKKVLSHLQLDHPSAFVITIAGTNGKGSTANTISSILKEMGLCVGLFTSPHIHQFNERICINQCPVQDQEILEAFYKIEDALTSLNENTDQKLQLSYFDFCTISALYLFSKAKVDVMVLEVGIGGRFDATNAIDANLCVITTIGLDHIEILGNSREEIALEKAGIFRSHVDVICTEEDPPITLLTAMADLQCQPYLLSKHYHYQTEPSKKRWTFYTEKITFALNAPKLLGEHQFKNCATSIMAILRTPFAKLLNEHVINQGLETLNLHGRFEIYPHETNVWVFDVTHNSQGATVLSKNLQALKETYPEYEIIAILGMLKNKDAHACVAQLVSLVKEWHFVSLEGERGQTASMLSEKLEDLTLTTQQYTNIEKACYHLKKTKHKHIILVFGSFHTVSIALQWFNHQK